MCSVREGIDCRIWERQRMVVQRRWRRARRIQEWQSGGRVGDGVGVEGMGAVQCRQMLVSIGGSGVRCRPRHLWQKVASGS